MTTLNTSAKEIPMESLRLAEYNPREVKRGDVDALKRSIEKFGLRGLITVNTNKKREGIIVGGNMTVTALRELGWTTVPAKNVDFVDLSESDEKGLSLALNKIAQLRNWNDETLAAMMVELNRNGFDTALTGFSEMEISGLLDSQMHGDPDGDDEEGDLEEQKEAIIEPKTKLGDMYRLGRHTLLCGDATNQADVDKLMENTKADLVFTDPPYNVAHVSHEKAGKFPTEKGKILNDDMSDEAFEVFSQKIFSAYYSVLKSGGSIYVCSGYSSYPLWYFEMLNAGFEFSTTIVWVKPSFAIGWGDYKKQYEQMLKSKKEKQKSKAQPVMYGWKKGTRHLFHGDNNESDVWEMPRKAVTRMAHPTEKPEWLIMRAIKNSSRVGQTVVDFFGGSGSTLFAANKLERSARLLELDPRWCDIIINRWEKLTGTPAVKL